MIIVLGEIRVHPDDVGKMRDLARPFIAENLKGDGCVSYAFSEDLLDPGRIQIAECWRDAAALDAHSRAPHYLAFAGQLPSLRMLGIKVVSYESGEGKVLIG